MSIKTNSEMKRFAYTSTHGDSDSYIQEACFCSMDDMIAACEYWTKQGYGIYRYEALAVNGVELTEDEKGMVDTRFEQIGGRMVERGYLPLWYRNENPHPAKALQALS